MRWTGGSARGASSTVQWYSIAARPVISAQPVRGYQSNCGWQGSVIGATPRDPEPHQSVDGRRVANGHLLDRKSGAPADVFLHRPIG